MPDSLDRELEQLLAYKEAPQAEAFVINVMQGVGREQRTRKIILWVFGLIGAMFGLAGAVMLSRPVGKLLGSDLTFPAMESMQAALFIVGACAFYLWFMNDDFSLGS